MYNTMYNDIRQLENFKSRSRPSPKHVSVYIPPMNIRKRKKTFLILFVVLA